MKWISHLSSKETFEVRILAGVIKKRLDSWCKECVYERQRLRWKDRKRKAVSLFGGSCSKCGYSRNLAALHFHHTKPAEKEYTWRHLRLKPWKNVIKELQKCILLCSNCHAEKHSPSWNLDLTCKGQDNVMLNGTTQIGLQPTGQCPECHVDVYGTKYCCQQCSHKSQRKANRPSKTKLKNMIDKMSLCAVSRKFGVSDNSVRKWAKSYHLL